MTLSSSMAWVLRRVGIFLLTAYALVTLTFICMKVLPGDPFSQEQALPSDVVAQLQHFHGLDKPLHVQYAACLSSALCFDFGYSYKFHDLFVTQIIAESFPISALLGVQAFCFSVSVWLILGILGALKSFSKETQISLFLVTLGISIPSFILASGFQYIFAIKLGWLPVGRWATFRHTILPTLSLAVCPIAFISRLFRSSVVEVMSQDYVRCAFAKGLSSYCVVKSHVIRNALMPVIPYLGQLLTNLLVGSFVVERIFGIPGLGQWFVNAVLFRDYNVIMGVTVFYGVLLLAFMLLVDLVAAWIDPQIGRNDAA